MVMTSFLPGAHLRLPSSPSPRVAARRNSLPFLSLSANPLNSIQSAKLGKSFGNVTLHRSFRGLQSKNPRSSRSLVIRCEASSSGRKKHNTVRRRCLGARYQSSSSFPFIGDQKEYPLPTSFGKRTASGVNSLKPFDICQGENQFPALTEFLLAESYQRGGRDKSRVLRRGMALLKGYLSHEEQVSIVRECRHLGLGLGGFYQPGYNSGAKLRLMMMCLGLDWDPQSSKYGNKRQIDNSRPPHIPPAFCDVVSRAMKDSQTLTKSYYEVRNVETILPTMVPDICIVNFYRTTGRLGLHQDRDESRDSLAKGLPVVSISVGDSAKFLYGDVRDKRQAKMVVIESGDVVIFGGKSRHIFHGVESIIPGSAPGWLLKGTGLRPGRLNLTFRQF